MIDRSTILRAFAVPGTRAVPVPKGKRVTRECIRCAVRDSTVTTFVLDDKPNTPRFHGPETGKLKYIRRVDRIAGVGL